MTAPKKPPRMRPWKGWCIVGKAYGDRRGGAFPTREQCGDLWSGERYQRVIVMDVPPRVVVTEEERA